MSALIATSRAADIQPRLAFPDRERLIRGLPFVGTSGAQDLLAGFDRLLLSANGFVVETGQYGIADRSLRISSIPTMSLVRATWSGFFQVGEARIIALSRWPCGSLERAPCTSCRSVLPRESSNGHRPTRHTLGALLDRRCDQCVAEPVVGPYVQLAGRGGGYLDRRGHIGVMLWLVAWRVTKNG